MTMAELRLPVALITALRQYHVVVRPDDCGGGLHEKNRLLGNRRAGLFGMIAVVEADAHELADPCYRRTEARIAIDRRQARGIEPCQGCQAFGGERSAVDVRHVGGQIPHRPSIVEQARLLGARGPVTQQFHVLTLPADDVRCARRVLVEGWQHIARVNV